MINIPNIQEQLYSRSEIAEMLQLTPRTIWKFQHDGRIVPAKIENRKPLFTLREVAKLLKEPSEIKTDSTKKL